MHDANAGLAHNVADHGVDEQRRALSPARRVPAAEAPGVHSSSWSLLALRRLIGQGVRLLRPTPVETIHPSQRHRPAVHVGDVEFFLLAEAGILEAQALLLCKSIRQFAGAYSSMAITVVSLRKERRPCVTTLRKLEQLGVEYLALDIQSPCPAYGVSFRVYVAAHIARRPGPPIVVQLDSDTLFLGEPDFSLEGVAAAARPVDMKGMCTTGAGDPFDHYWHDLCRLCGVDYSQLPLLVTTVDRRTVRASYNGGLLAVRRASSILERTQDYFERLTAANLKPWVGSGLQVRSGAGVVDTSGSEYWGTSQAAFSLAVTAGGHRLEVLPRAYNVPLHLFDALGSPADIPIHVHYHDMLSSTECVSTPLLDGRVPLSQETVAWLKKHVSLVAAPV